MLKTLMTHKNCSLHRARWIKKMILFNFIIHDRPKVKMDYIDFAFKINTFLFKDNINASISTLREQKLSDYL